MRDTTISIIAYIGKSMTLYAMALFFVYGDARLEALIPLRLCRGCTYILGATSYAFIADYKSSFHVSRPDRFDGTVL